MPSDHSSDALDDVLAEVRSLRATVERQERDLAALRSSHDPATPRPTSDHDAESRGPVSRRAAMLGIAGAGVAGLSVVGSALPAAAVDGEPVLVGGEYDAMSVTKLTNSSATDAALQGVSTATGVAIAGPANAVKGETTAADNGAHTILGTTAGTGHAVAGVTSNAANAVATTWGRGNHVGAAVEGEQINTTGIALAGGGNAVKGIIYSGSKGDPQPSDNHSHSVLGVTYGGGHAVAGATPATAKSHTGSGLSTISTTWGRNSALGPGVEGEQNTAETVALAGDANAVKGIIFSGPKSAPTASPNGSHAILGITYGAGHSVAGDTPDGVDNTVAATWGRHKGDGAGIGGVSTRGYGGEFVGGKASVRLIPNEAEGAPETGEHLVGELFMASNGNLYLCTEAGEPGTFVLLNGTGGPTILAVPERSVDNVTMGVQETRTFDLTNTSLPDSAASAIVTVTVIPQSNAGHVSLYSAGETIVGAPGFSTLNWGGGGDRKPETNTTSVRVADGEIKVFSANAARVYIDVVGFSMPMMEPGPWLPI